MGGYFRISLAAIIWGSLGVIVRVIDLPVLVLVFGRVFFAAVTVLVFIVVRQRIGTLFVGSNIYLLIFMGILLALNWTSFFFSVKLTSIANAVLITYTAPILVAFLAPRFLNEQIERITIIALFVSLIGAALIASPSAIALSRNDLIGIGWAIVSSITYAILVILAKPLTERVSVPIMIFYEELACAAVLSPAIFVLDFTIDATLMLILFVLGAVHTAFAAGLYLSGLRQVKAHQVGVFTYLDPVSAIAFAALFLGEIPGATTITGGALIIVSGLILIFATRTRIRTEVVSE